MVRTGDCMNWKSILGELEQGTLRAAQPEPDGSWTVNLEVKQAILEAFRQGSLVPYGDSIDKDTVPPRKLTVSQEIRLVPSGSTIRSPCAMVTRSSK